MKNYDNDDGDDDDNPTTAKWNRKVDKNRFHFVAVHTDIFAFKYVRYLVSQSTANVSNISYVYSMIFCASLFLLWLITTKHIAREGQINAVDFKFK